MQDKQFSDVLSKAEVVWAHAGVLRQLFPQTGTTVQNQQWN